MAYLVLPDGGKVEFAATRHSYKDADTGQWYSYYTYQARALIDPYLLRTTLSYYTDGSLHTIQEPAGRWLELVYRSSDHAIDHILASDGRVVQYNYTTVSYASGTAYTALDNVVYPYEDTLQTSPTAHYTYQAPNVGYAGMNPLLSSCDDPMYAGPMKKISYTYATGINNDNSAAVFGQIKSENSGTTGQAVTSLDLSVSGRIETRADGNFREFQYGNGRIANQSDFYFHFASQQYDATTGFLNAISDRNGHQTDIVSDPITGNATQITFPPTPNDTPSGTPRGQVSFVYGSATCPDPNNREPYYLFSSTDEAGHTTYYWRDANRRINQIDYPDGGYETFSYDPFGNVATHQLRSGGTESFGTDTIGQVSWYRDADHDPIGQTGPPKAWYQHNNSLDLVSDMTDGQGSYPGNPSYTTSYSYNQRGQMTVKTLPSDPNDGVRHTIATTYNPNGDGTLVSVADPLGHVTSYSYDDYKRLRSVTTPGHNTPVTAYMFYDATGTGDDYSHTEGNVTYAVLPSGKKAVMTYDADMRKHTVTVSGADGSEALTTAYTYDDAGNLKTVIAPDPQTGQANTGRTTTYNYDERNRPSSVVDALQHATSYLYDAGGRKSQEQRPNGQIISFASYDQMNRLLQQIVTQAPTPDAVTNYTWWTSGLLHTMQDPNQHTYVYEYDPMGRKKTVTYPPDSANIVRSESYTYDPITGHLQTFTNRTGNIQTFTYDNLNRPTWFQWDDGVTSPQQMTYDAASRVTQIWNWDATLNYTYWDNNLLKTEQEVTGSNYNHTTSYTYDADGNRASLTCPSGKVWQYSYNQRNQMNAIGNENWDVMVSYQYDAAGNRQSRAMYNGVITEYAPVDALNRSPWTRHMFNGTELARFDYAFDELNRMKYEQRNGATADGYAYDQASEVIGFNRDGTLSNGVVTGGNVVSTLGYDSAGNRSQVTSNGAATTWSVNNLNEYTGVGNNPVGSDANGNVSSYNGWTYSYDAQNRLRVASGNGKTLEFWYDGRNRQIARRIDGDYYQITRTVWDGWSVLEERDVNDAPREYYLHGAGTDELVLRWGGAYGDHWYGYDGRGNVSHLFGYSWSGLVVESYTYDLAGAPTFSGPNNESLVDNRFLFQGRDYLKEGGIYDYRNRFYHPNLGRFMQSDPLGFGGGDANIYRYCGGDPVNRRDPSGLGFTFVDGRPLYNRGDLNYTPTGDDPPSELETVPSGGGGSVTPDSGSSLPGGVTVSVGGPAGGVNSGTGLPSYTPAINAMGAIGRVDNGGNAVAFEPGFNLTRSYFSGTKGHISLNLNGSVTEMIPQFSDGIQDGTSDLINIIALLNAPRDAMLLLTAITRVGFDGVAEAASFFEGAQYGEKVLWQMRRGAGEFHSFPESVTAFERTGTVDTITSLEGNSLLRLRIPGSYLSSNGNWYQGEFRFIKDNAGIINERRFVPYP